MLFKRLGGLKDLSGPQAKKKSCGLSNIPHKKTFFIASRLDHESNLDFSIQGRFIGLARGAVYGGGAVWLVGSVAPPFSEN